MNEASHNYLILVAGGTSTRMDSDRPKQFLLLSGKAIMLHALDNFFKFDSSINCIIVLHKNWMSEFEKMIANHPNKNQIKIVAGGETRFHSVKNGLTAITGNEGVVGIHDAARPLASLKTISLSYAKAKESGNGIPAIQLNESLRQVTENTSAPINRGSLRVIQTPQCFDLAKLKKAFSTLEYKETFTDDATVFEAAGHKINLVEGNRENIKITHPEDMLIAETLLNQLAKK